MSLDTVRLTIKALLESDVFKGNRTDRVNYSRL